MNTGRAVTSAKFTLKQAEIAMSGSGASEVEFRLKQNPHLSYFTAKAEVEKYAKAFGDRLVWC